MQTIPPVRLTLPLSLASSAVGLLALVVAILLLIADVVLRPTLGQMLHLNED